MSEDPTAVEKSPEIAPTSVSKSFWARTPLESKIAIFALAATTLFAMPGMILNFRALGDGPRLTVSSVSGPYESLETLSDAELTSMTWYSRIKIGNIGNQPATNVAIPWESGGYATIIDINGESKSLLFNKRLELGELPRDATIEVSLWTEETFSSESSQIPKISHSTGSKQIFEHPPLPWYLSPTNYAYWITIGFAFFCIWFSSYRFERSSDEILMKSAEFASQLRKDYEESYREIQRKYEESTEEAQRIYKDLMENDVGKVSRDIPPCDPNEK